MPGSCSSGFRSLPSAAAGTRRRNGLDVNSRNIRKPTETKPITASTRASSAAGRLRERSVTAVAQPVSISTHSSSEPSCEPQVAAIRYCSGNWVFEFCATLSTEKSLVAKLHARHPNASAISANCKRAAGLASPISTALRRCAPISGTTLCTSATSSARMRANCPSSGIIWRYSMWGATCPCLFAPSRWRGPLPGACNFRHAWPVLRSRETRRPARCCLVPPRPCLP